VVLKPYPKPGERMAIFEVSSSKKPDPRQKWPESNQSTNWAWQSNEVANPGVRRVLSQEVQVSNSVFSGF
jgi:hypothetical protein